MGRYVASDSGWNAWATGEDMERFIRARGEEWADRLKQIVGRRTGTYVRSIQVTTHNSLIRSKPRVAARITATARYAAALEYGNSRMPNPPKPLTRLLDEMQAADPRFKG